MDTEGEASNETVSGERFAKLEARLVRVEESLQLLAKRTGTRLREADAAPQVGIQDPSQDTGIRAEDDLEFALGQKWFARAGILVLSIGAAFTLSLPYAGLPSFLPSLLGYALAGGLFLLAHFWRQSFGLVSRYVRGSAMLLLFFATLRLYYFSTAPPLSVASTGGKLFLIFVVGTNLVIALRRQSPWLLTLGLIMGHGAALLLKSPDWLFPMVLALSAVTAYAWIKHRWSFVLLLGMHATYLTHLLWAVNNPLIGNEFHFAREPFGSLFYLLSYGVVLALPSFFSHGREEHHAVAVANAFLNMVFCYSLFLAHSAVSFRPEMVFSHLTASVVFLGLAAALWLARHSEIGCFFYAMTGYLALSVSILAAFSAPGVYVWLSMQSLIVLTTALWFRSPFIMVANFFIYVAIVLGSMIVATGDTGISIGFGLVAMLSARILNWQKERLHLRTELMRNAYLFIVFVMFPYALYHLVPKSYVAISWVGMTAVYYLMSRFFQNAKYRWMGHFTILLAFFYILIVGIIQLNPAQRIISYLVLGVVLVLISLVFSRQRNRSPMKKEEARLP